MADEKTREAIYDEQINPLMAQIIAICQAHDIPIFASFQINDGRPDEVSLFCTTSILPDGADEALRHCQRTLYPPRDLAFTITTRDADGKPTSITRVLP